MDFTHNIFHSTLRIKSNKSELNVSRKQTPTHRAAIAVQLIIPTVVAGWWVKYWTL